MHAPRCASSKYNRLGKTSQLPAVKPIPRSIQHIFDPANDVLKTRTTPKSPNASNNWPKAARYTMETKLKQKKNDHPRRGATSRQPSANGRLSSHISAFTRPPFPRWDRETPSSRCSSRAPLRPFPRRSGPFHVRRMGAMMRRYISS